MVGGAPQPAKRTRSAFKENPDQTRIKQKDRELMLCKCYKLIELSTNARQKSLLLRNDFFFNIGKLTVNHEVLKEYHRRGLAGLELGGGLTPPRDGVAEHCSPLFPWQLMTFHGFLGIFWVYKL